MASTGLRMCTAILPSQCQIKPTGLWGRKWAVAATFSSPKPLGLICKRKSGSGWNGKYDFFHWLKATECAHQLKSTTLAAHNISDVHLSNCKHDLRRSRQIAIFTSNHNSPCLPLIILHNHCFHFCLGVAVVPKEIQDNGYAIFFREGGWGVNKVPYGKW